MMINITILAYILIILDLLFTRRLIDIYGLSVEANPIGRWILESPIKQIIFKLLVPALALIFLYKHRDRRMARIGLKVVLIVYMLIAVYHCILITL